MQRGKKGPSSSVEGIIGLKLKKNYKIKISVNSAFWLAIYPAQWLAHSPIVAPHVLFPLFYIYFTQIYAFFELLLS